MSDNVGVEETTPISASEQKLIDKWEGELGADHNIHECTMLRFIRGFVTDEKPEEKADEMFQEFIKWRAEKKVDEIVATQLEGEEKFRTNWPTGLHGISKSGHPVYIERLGEINLSVIMEEFGMEKAMKFHIQTMENLCKLKEDLTDERKKRVYKHVVILDLDGVGWSHCSKKFYGPIQEMLALDQGMYPETLKIMIIINASWVFKALWKIAKMWVDPVTKSKIFWGTEHLTKFIDAEQIPVKYGGSCKCEGGKCLIVPFASGAEEADDAKGR